MPKIIVHYKPLTKQIDACLLAGVPDDDLEDACRDFVACIPAEIDRVEIEVMREDQCSNAEPPTLEQLYAENKQLEREAVKMNTELYNKYEKRRS